MDDVGRMQILRRLGENIIASCQKGQSEENSSTSVHERRDGEKRRDAANRAFAERAEGRGRRVQSSRPSSECACLERAQDLVDEELDVVVREALRLHDRVHVLAHQRRHQVPARSGTHASYLSAQLLLHPIVYSRTKRHWWLLCALRVHILKQSRVVSLVSRNSWFHWMHLAKRELRARVLELSLTYA